MPSINPLPADLVAQFADAYYADFGRVLPPEEADAMATKLVDFTLLLGRILERRKQRLERGLDEIGKQKGPFVHT